MNDEERMSTEHEPAVAEQSPIDGALGQGGQDGPRGHSDAADAADPGWSAPNAARLEDGQAVAEVVVSVDDGALRVRGGDVGVRARGRGAHAPRIERDGERVRVHLAEGGDLEMPRGARLVLGALPAAVSVRGVLGAVDGERVDGDARLADVGPATLGAIGGAFTAEGVAGDLDIAAIGSSARIADVRGDLRLPMVGGSVRIVDVSGDLAVTAGGGAKVVVTPRNGGAYRLTAGGGIRWHVPEALNAAVSIAAGGRVRVDVPGAARAPGAPAARYEAVLGDGGATLDLAAGGSVRLGSGPGHEGWEGAMDGEPLGGMAERIGLQVEGIAEMISARITEAVGGLPETLAQRGLSLDQVEGIAERLQHAGERAAEQVERKLRRMAEKAERMGERAERHASERLHRHDPRGAAWAFRGPSEGPRAPSGVPSAPPGAAAGGAANAEEVMTILRMVEGGKISAEEAERLISALGAARA